MIPAILEAVTLVTSILGLVVASKGAVKTQSFLRQGDQHDKIIDALAWFDRRLTRPAKVTTGANGR